MRVLFVPYAGSPVTHLLPLVALASRLARGRDEPLFLAPRTLHCALASLGLPVVDVDYQQKDAFRAEMRAYAECCPDVVVDDLSGTVLLSTTLTKRPRVTVRRSGDFPGAVARNRSHRYGLGTDSDVVKGYESCAKLGIQPPRTLADVLRATMNVIPGIPAIEMLPPAVADDPTYVFAGPLLPDESASGAIIGAVRGREADSGAVRAFLDANQHRRVVCLTLGTILRAGDYHVHDVVHRILDAGAAIVSSVDLPAVADSARGRCFHAPTIPLGLVASRADLMIHHCGNGTYQYAILHALPSICIGSGFYDRDNVAMRLADLGVAKYVPAPLEMPDFVERFTHAFDECIDVEGPWYQEAKWFISQIR
jgi:UDP:flavonoid glycosyltransferase YjiC (YdhE family)